MGFRPGSVGLNRRDQGIGPDAAKLLVAASEQPTREGIAVALELGSDINATNNRGDTAAHAAAQLGYSSAVRLLVEHGAKLDIKNKAGRTARDMMGPGADSC